MPIAGSNERPVFADLGGEPHGLITIHDAGLQSFTAHRVTASNSELLADTDPPLEAQSAFALGAFGNSTDTLVVKTGQADFTPHGTAAGSGEYLPGATNGSFGNGQVDAVIGVMRVAPMGVAGADVLPVAGTTAPSPQPHLAYYLEPGLPPETTGDPSVQGATVQAMGVWSPEPEHATVVLAESVDGVSVALSRFVTTNAGATSDVAAPLALSNELSSLIITGVEVAPLTGDGSQVDALVATEGEVLVVFDVLQMAADGTVNAQVLPVANVVQLGLRDLDGDGDPDLVVGQRSPRGVRWLRNDAGNFADADDLVPGRTVGPWFDFKDVDGSGRDELVTWDDAAGTAALFFRFDPEEP